jgi:endonuclease/exonuclease/phosphatase family metal-dependent hydrolase
MIRLLIILVLVFSFNLYAQTGQTIEIGAFNIEWFPCKDDGEMMKKYGIELRYPPQGNSTNIKELFNLLKEVDIELLAVEEIVDPQMLADSAKKYLGDNFEFIYSEAGGSQKVGFLYDSSIIKLAGEPQTYTEVMLTQDSRLRPAFRAYFKAVNDGFDFHAIVVHLKASPRGWDQRKQQLEILENILSTLPEESHDSDIIVMGDMNNVTDAGAEEFKSMLQRLNFHWASEKLDGLATNYWQPDWKKHRIIPSVIDHIFVSDDANVELVQNSVKVGGMCAKKISEYTGDKFPDYFENISDHCPVYVSFKFDKDDD